MLGYLVKTSLRLGEVDLRTLVINPKIISQFVAPLPPDSKAAPCSITQKRTYWLAVWASSEFISRCGCAE